jgi:hypothetical protein
MLVTLFTRTCIEMPGIEACNRVLFIGNSYTYENDLPGMFAELARSGGHKVETGMSAEGGWSFADHVKSSGTAEILKSKQWDYVILQEQSEMPAFEQSRTQNMYPAARELVRQVRASAAKPVFFLTWAHRDGLPDNGLPGFEPMQVQLDQGYLAIARELNVSVAPAGYAWVIVLRQNPALNLWQNDGSHPNEQGTYLAACVFYATIFRQSPEGLNYRANVPEEIALFLQKIAAESVLNNPEQWNLK